MGSEKCCTDTAPTRQQQARDSQKVESWDERCRKRVKNNPEHERANELPALRYRGSPCCSGDEGEGIRALAAQKWKSKDQRAAWDVVNYLRCIVEVTPRDVQADDATRWWDEVVKALEVLGIRKTEISSGTEHH